MNYEKTKKPHVSKSVAPDNWVALLQDCITAVVKLEKAETVRLAPLVKEAGIDEKNDRSGFLKKTRKDKAAAEDVEFADVEMDDEGADEPADAHAAKDGRSTQRKNFETWADEKTAARIKFFNENKDPLLIAFSAATTKSFCKWYDVRSGVKTSVPVEDMIAKTLAGAAEALEGLASARPDDKKLNALSARMNALANPVVPETQPAADVVVAREEAPAAKKRGRPCKVTASSVPAL